MRLFPNLHTAIREIHRDLYKAPRIKSSRVQHVMGDFMTGEAAPYSLALPAKGIPHEPEQLIETAREAGLQWWDDHASIDLLEWLAGELDLRLSDTLHPNGFIAEHLHPELAPMLEGNHYGYTYAERTVGMLSTMANHLDRSPDSRRCYWPIFHPMDAIRAVSPTRVPCTLGYQALIRPGPGGKPALEFTIISRSCDYEKFWVSDLWFAYRIAHTLRQVLVSGNGHPELQMGNIYHHILSFHRFIDEGEETY